MRAGGEPAQQMFGADDGEGEGLRGAVERGRDHEAAGLQQGCAIGEKAGGIGDVLYDFEGEDDVEAFLF